MKAAIYGILAYAVSLGTLAYFVGFVGNLLVSPSLDSPASGSVARALAVDCGWFVVFAVQHSAMARASFKRRWMLLIPAGTERSTYVLASSLMFILLFVVWQPIPTVIWRVPPGPAWYAMMGLSLGGWVLAVAATFAIDHFELFGLRQAMGGNRGLAQEPVLRTPALYRLVRHPLYLGFFLAFWSAPLMTVGHAVFAAGMTFYIAIGMRFEERDLLRTFGERYVRYRESVPALLPWPRPRRRTTPATTDVPSA